MKRGDQHGGAVRVHAPAQLPDRLARAEDDRGASVAELALATALERRLLGPERLGGPQEIVTFQGKLGEAEVAMVAQGLAQRAECVGERRARIACRHAGQAGVLRVAAPARRARTCESIASATADFAIRGSARAPPQRSSRSTSLSSASKPMPCWLTSFATSRSMPLLSSLARAFAATSFVSAAKPTTNARVRRAATSARMSGFGVSSSVTSCLPLIFTVAGCLMR